MCANGCRLIIYINQLRIRNPLPAIFLSRKSWGFVRFRPHGVFANTWVQALKIIFQLSKGAEPDGGISIASSPGKGKINYS